MSSDYFWYYHKKISSTLFVISENMKDTLYPHPRQEKKVSSPSLSRCYWIYMPSSGNFSTFYIIFYFSDNNILVKAARPPGEAASYLLFCPFYFSSSE